MPTAKEVQIWVTVGYKVVKLCETVYGKLRDWTAPGLSIECPHCGKSQSYELGTLKQGWFSRYFECSDCGKRIKVDIEVKVDGQ